MRSKATVNFKFWCKRYEIILVPVFICVRKDKIERTLYFFHKHMGISKACIDIFGKPGLFEINKRLFMSSFIDFNGDEFAPCFAHRPGNPGAGMTRRGADFESVFVIVFYDNVK